MAYGSDLLGEMHRHQSSEFVIRGEVLPAIRKTGGYARNTHVALPDFADPVAAARAWADATESKLKAEAALATVARDREADERGDDIGEFD